MRRPRLTLLPKVATWMVATLSGIGLAAALALLLTGAQQPPGAVNHAAGGDGHPAAAGPPRALAAPPATTAPFAIREHVIAKNSSLSRSLQSMGMPNAERRAVAGSLAPHLALAQIAAGTRLQAFTLAATDPYPRRIDIILTPATSLRCEQTAAGSWRVQRHAEAVERRLSSYSGVVTSSLWSSATAAGMDPQLVARLSEIFAWQVDFHHEVRRGDRWRLSVERFYSNGSLVRVGAITAAEYDNAGTINGAVLAADDQYYTPEGGSLRRMFLRSPLRFAHITSGFSQHRFHPILKVQKPHHGIDYGAPAGTPVMAVGTGEVTFAGTSGGSGKMIALRHGTTYATQYKHLSRFADGVQAGKRVKMGEVIGYVGKTGLATGPHLHFEFHVKGRYQDPSTLRFPAAEPVPPAQLAAFRLTASKALAELPPWSAGVLTQARSAERQAEDTRAD